MKNKKWRIVYDFYSYQVQEKTSWFGITVWMKRYDTLDFGYAKEFVEVDGNLEIFYKKIK